MTDSAISITGISPIKASNKTQAFPFASLSASVFPQSAERVLIVAIFQVGSAEWPVGSYYYCAVLITQYIFAVCVTQLSGVKRPSGTMLSVTDWRLAQGVPLRSVLEVGRFSVFKFGQSSRLRLLWPLNPPSSLRSHPVLSLLPSLKMHLTFARLVEGSV